MVKKIAIVSLSRGILGESFVKHELNIGLKRLKQFGLEVIFMPHALLGLDYIKKHPEKRAEDLLNAFKDETIDMILCAVGGDDTYTLLPYLFDHDELKKAINKKIFLGFSDTTWNHFMLFKVGLNTFYGQAFLPDICELAPTMLPYTKNYFLELINQERINKITPSKVYYSSREDFSIKAIGTYTKEFINEGFISLQGKRRFQGKIFGGCIDSIYDMFDNSRYQDSVELSQKYQIFPSLKDWKNKILLLESSEEKPSPQLFKKMLLVLKSTGIFNVISGIIIGKNPDETHQESHYQILIEVVDNPNLAIVGNINIGHSTPRCIIPFGVLATVDVDKQEIVFDYQNYNLLI